MKIRTLSTFTMVLASKHEEEKCENNQGNHKLNISKADDNLRTSFSNKSGEIYNIPAEHIGLHSDCLDPLTLVSFCTSSESLLELDESLYKPVIEKIFIKLKDSIHPTKISPYTAMLNSSEGSLEGLYAQLTKMKSDSSLGKFSHNELHTKLKFLLNILQSFCKITPVIDGKHYLETSTDVLKFLLSDLIAKVHDRIASLRSSKSGDFENDVMVSEALNFYSKLMYSIDKDILSGSDKLQQYFQDFISNLAEIVKIINCEDHPNRIAIGELIIIFQSYSELLGLITDKSLISKGLSVSLNNSLPMVNRMIVFILKRLFSAHLDPDSFDLIYSQALNNQDY